MVTFDESRRHGDVQRIGSEESRKRSALDHLEKLFGNLSSEERRRVNNILEIGIGRGGATLALQEFFPTAQITAVDRDENSQSVSEKLDVKFFNNDILDINDDFIFELTHGVELIIALRTSGEVAIFLLNKLEEIDFSGFFVFSLLAESDRQFFSQVEESIRSLEGRKKIPLVEGRNFNEYAWVVNFQRRSH